MRLRIALVPLVAFLTMGCGSVGNRFDGTVAGHTLHVEETLFFPLRDSSGATLGAAVAMADTNDLCGALAANRIPPSMTHAWFFVFRTQDDGSTRIRLAPDRGMYTVVLERNAANLAAVPFNYAFAGFFSMDASCTSTIPMAQAEGQSGTVEVDNLDFTSPGTMTGKFEVSFGSQGERGTGTFNASLCDTNLYVSRTCG